MEYEFEVAEDFRATHFYYVNAATRAEALEKVLNWDHRTTDIYVERGQPHPSRTLGLRDVKRGRRLA